MLNYNFNFKNLKIKNLENLKNIYIFINEVCVCIIDYENYNDFKIDINNNNNLIIYFKNKKILKYNLKNDYFKLYKYK